jgi:hypothetical protein
VSLKPELLTRLNKAGIRDGLVCSDTHPAESSIYLFSRLYSTWLAASYNVNEAESRWVYHFLVLVQNSSSRSDLAYIGGNCIGR